MNRDLIVEVSLPTLVLSLVILVFSVLFLYKRLFVLRKARSSTIDITGVVQSGKTALFYKLTENENPETVSSITQNSAEVNLFDGKYRLIDFPGHARLRPELLGQLRKSSPGVVVVVVDGMERASVKETGELMFELMTIENLGSPMVIAVSKSDLDNYRSPGVVAAEIEREIDAVRKSREAEGVYLGVYGENFKLSKHCPFEIRLCGFSSKGEMKGLLAAIGKSVNCK